MTAIDSIINSMFIGIGVAIGTTINELWIKPYLKKIHRKTKKTKIKVTLP